MTPVSLPPSICSPSDHHPIRTEDLRRLTVLVSPTLVPRAGVNGMCLGTSEIQSMEIGLIWGCTQRKPFHQQKLGLNWLLGLAFHQHQKTTQIYRKTIVFFTPEQRLKIFGSSNFGILGGVTPSIKSRCDKCPKHQGPRPDLVGHFWWCSSAKSHDTEQSLGKCRHPGLEWFRKELRTPLDR